MFKVGDRVRRKPEHRKDGWTLEDSVLAVTEADDTMIRFDETPFGWSPKFFDLVQSYRNRCVEAMVAGKVGPHKVRVWVNVDPATPLTEVHGKQVEAVLDEVRDDYETDPEFGQDDIIVRLQERLESIEAVAAYEITGLDGCGFVVYPDWR
jgi:hypothetical protein